MAKKFISLLTATAAIGIATLFAQESGTAKTAEGTLMVQDKNYPLTHALAYETKINDEEVIAVVLSGQAISSEKLKEAKSKCGLRIAECGIGERRRGQGSSVATSGCGRTCTAGV